MLRFSAACRAALVLAGFVLAAPAADATPVSLSATFTDGTEASGSFGLNSSGYIDASLTALLTRDGTGTSGAFAGYPYVGGNSFGSHNPGSGYFEFDRTGGGYSQYQNAFILRLTAPEHAGWNSVSLTGSYECVGSFSCYDPTSSDGNRRFFAAARLLIGVPEPATMALLGAALLLMGGLRRRG